MFTAVTLITLAAGVGANTVVFSVLEGILLKPLPYTHSDRVVVISHSAAAINSAGDFPGAPSNYFIYRDQNKTFDDIAMMTNDSV
ncbi:MAG TPA: multidrug ABC transporter substrate-binding protein, partial [Candidatus Angelobacter sp.]|nr:multidrug ABC transporter substrate-binding protein [Candidatus Angelobacter sp.]